MKEDTKEIKDLKELEPTREEEVEVAETQPVEVEEEKSTEKKEKKPVNKKVIFIIVGVVAAILLIAILVILFLPKEKEEKEKKQDPKVSNFVKVVTESLESGELVKEINKGLQENSISADKVLIMSMDFDSDKDQELMVYAEDGDKKYLLQLEIDENVTYDDSYPMTSKDSIGYVYSGEKDSNFWYTEYEKNYTIVSSTKKIIKEDDFLENYFVLTQTYKEKAIFQNAVEYNMDKNLDVEKLEEKAFSNKDLLADNDIEEKDIKDAYKDYLKKKEEEDKKKKEEEEAKAAEEELQKKLSGTLQLGNAHYKFGTYNIYDAKGNPDGKLILYSDMTCEHKGLSCTYTVGSARDSEEKEVPGISLSTGQIYIVSKTEGELTDETETFSIRYAG